MRKALEESGRECGTCGEVLEGYMRHTLTYTWWESQIVRISVVGVKMDKIVLRVGNKADKGKWSRTSGRTITRGESVYGRYCSFHDLYWL